MGETGDGSVASALVAAAGGRALNRSLNSLRLSFGEGEVALSDQASWLPDQKKSYARFGLNRLYQVVSKTMTMSFLYDDYRPDLTAEVGFDGKRVICAIEEA